LGNILGNIAHILGNIANNFGNWDRRIKLHFGQRLFE
jgi:hypothetical protein